MPLVMKIKVIFTILKLENVPPVEIYKMDVPFANKVVNKSSVKNVSR